MGDHPRRDALHALVPAADRPHGREARRLPVVRRRAADGVVRRVAAHPVGAGRVELSVGRTARDVGSARLHGVEPGEPGVHRRVGGGEDAVHPVGVRRLQRRSARRDDAAAPELGRALRQSDGAARAFGRPRRISRVHDPRPRAGVFPHRPRAFRAAPRPRDGRPHADRRAAAARPAARGPLLRRHPGAHPGLHCRSRI